MEISISGMKVKERSCFYLVWLDSLESLVLFSEKQFSPKVKHQIL
jgi:hypothetical protein